jgi:hypothetical protein
MLQVFQQDVACVSIRGFKCFSSSKWMLKVFKPDIAGVSTRGFKCFSSNKCLFQVCHVVFHLRVASVYIVHSGCRRCLN